MGLTDIINNEDSENYLDKIKDEVKNLQPNNLWKFWASLGLLTINDHVSVWKAFFLIHQILCDKRLKSSAEINEKKAMIRKLVSGLTIDNDGYQPNYYLSIILIDLLNGYDSNDRNKLIELFDKYTTLLEKIIEVNEVKKATDNTEYKYFGIKTLVDHVDMYNLQYDKFISMPQVAEKIQQEQFLEIRKRYLEIANKQT